jgi:hypothetical protein
VYIYSGDWDATVPFTDTIKNLNRLALKQDGLQTPWSVGGQHAGFLKKYNFGVNYFLVKGAGSQMPMYQPERGKYIFQKFLNDP